MIRWRVVVDEGVTFHGKSHAIGDEIVASAESVAEISYGLEFIASVQS